MFVTTNIDMAESKVSTEAFGFAACSHRSPIRTQTLGEKAEYGVGKVLSHQLHASSRLEY